MQDYIDYILRDDIFTRKAISTVMDSRIYPFNDKWMLASFPINKSVEPTFEYLDYSLLSKIYGLSDLSAANTSGVAAVRRQPILSLYGQNTLIAIIDTGINWRHEAFVNEDNRTKIDVYWDQEKDIVYTADDINRALAGEDIDIPLDEDGHGTAMAGIAIGRENKAAEFSGVAPYARLVAVRLKPACDYFRDFYLIKDGARAYLETDIIRAVFFASKYATQRELPISYAIGVGTSLGSHSGNSPLCSILDDEAERPGRCVTIASGNEGNARLHHRGFYGNTMQSVEIRVAAGERGFVCELWSRAPEVYGIEIISPTGQITGRIPNRNNKSYVIDFPFENSRIELYSRLFETSSGQNVLAMRFIQPAEGIWTILLYGENIIDGTYDIWINNKSFMESGTFLLVSDPYETVVNPANTGKCICVCAYNDRDNSIYAEGSRGYATYNLQKPDFAAPGVNLVVPDIFDNSSYTVRSGSSLSAAFFAGVGALFLEYGIVRGRIPNIRTSEIKNLTISGCNRKRELTYPNREWGYGSINLYSSLEKLRQNI